MKSDNKVVIKMPFRDIGTYRAVRAAPAVLYTGVGVSPPPPTLSSNSPASLVDILF